MKTFLYSVCVAGILLLSSFAPRGKQSKIKFPKDNLAGHIEWVKIIPYHAVKDSSGSIVKGDFFIFKPLHESPSHLKRNHYRPQVNSVINLNGDACIYGYNMELWIYNEQGDRVEADYWNLDGTTSKIITQYNPNGDIKDIKFIGVSRRCNIRNDTSRRMLYSEIYGAGKNSIIDSFCCPTNYVYDSSGKLLKKNIYKSETAPVPVSSTLFRYNKKGQLTEEDMTAPDLKYVFTRDSKGRVIDTATYRNGSLIADQKITFHGSKGIVEQENDYDVNGIGREYSISHFNPEKHLLDKEEFRITPNSNGRGDTTMLHHVITDKNFNIIKDDRYDNDGKLLYENTYQYKYDSFGNWTEQLMIVDGNPFRIFEREIHYFPGQH